MIKIGLTGGIGCGKTTVLREFERQGVACFVADEAAARYYDEPAFVKEVEAIVGRPITDSEGRADKKAVAAAVFADDAMLARLNALVHPRVMRDFDRWCGEHGGAKCVVFESAILYESGLDRMMDAVVAVYLDPEERMRRLLIRDRVPKEQIALRMAHQTAAEEKLDRADYVVLNYEGNPRARQVEHILNEILNKQAQR